MADQRATPTGSLVLVATQHIPVLATRTKEDFNTLVVYRQRVTRQWIQTAPFPQTQSTRLLVSFSPHPTPTEPGPYSHACLASDSLYRWPVVPFLPSFPAAQCAVNSASPPRPRRIRIYTFSIPSPGIPLPCPPLCPRVISSQCRQLQRGEMAKRPRPSPPPSAISPAPFNAERLCAQQLNFQLLPNQKNVIFLLYSCVCSVYCILLPNSESGFSPTVASGGGVYCTPKRPCVGLGFHCRR